jgi:cytochrome P450
MPQNAAGYRPPAPMHRPMLARFDSDLLEMMSASFYRRAAIRLPGKGRDVFIANDPAEIRNILAVSVDAFPKSDLMIAALRPLLGDGFLISNGPIWQRQRRMLEPALSQMHLRRIYPLLSATITDFVAKLRSQSTGTEIALNGEMSFVALDMIFRTIFSRPISDEEGRILANAFAEYQDKAPQDIITVLFGNAASDELPQAELNAIGARIRSVIEGLVDERLTLSSRASHAGDILQSVIDARDPEDGSAFSREDIVNQITVLFLAGHETSASALTWSLFILSQQPQLAERIRSEAIALAGERPLTQDEVNKIVIARNIFREALRLYPPAGFISRAATKAAMVGHYEIESGSLIVISPWLLHRHHKYWKDPDIFDPERFSAAREREIVPGTFIPFGLGARVCTGRTIAMIEGPLVIAELMRAFRFVTPQADAVTPSFRLTVRPKVTIRCRVETLPVAAHAHAGEGLRQPHQRSG